MKIESTDTKIEGVGGNIFRVTTLGRRDLLKQEILKNELLLNGFEFDEKGAITNLHERLKLLGEYISIATKEESNVSIDRLNLISKKVKDYIELSEDNLEEKVYSYLVDFKNVKIEFDGDNESNRTAKVIFDIKRDKFSGLVSMKNDGYDGNIQEIDRLIKENIGYINEKLCSAIRKFEGNEIREFMLYERILEVLSTITDDDLRYSN